MKPMDHKELENQEPRDFWEDRYAQSLERKRGKAGQILREKISGLTPGKALELGCSTGDDSLWLAEQGWKITAVDISTHAIQTARRLAQEAGLAEHIQFSALDLAAEFPDGAVDLVCAMYFQSPFDFPRIAILKRAAQQLVSGGHLLVVTHASPPPWATKHNPEHVFPVLESDWEALALAKQDWELLDFCVQKRLARGPDGQEAEVKDNLIFVRRN